MDWETYFFDIISSLKAKSKDPSTKVGCVISSKDNDTVATGFNGFPRGVEDSIDIVPDRYERPKKYSYIEHAERNAIYSAAKRGISLDGCKLFLEWYPCCECMRAIIQSGIKEVVINGDSKDFNNEELIKRWKDSVEISLVMAKEAGIKITIYRKG